MGKRRTRRGQSGRSARKGRQYILAGIAAAVVIIAAAAVLWQFFGKAGSGKDNEASQNGSGQTVQSGEKTEQTDDEDAGEGKQSEETAGREDSSVEVEAGEILESMTLEEKVCQIFMITPEALTGAGTVVQAGTSTKNAIDQYPVGGLIYFSQNLQDPGQTRTMLANTQQYAKERTGFPIFLSVDEEGGQVARVGSNPAFGVEKIGNMSDVGSRGDTQEAYEVGSTIGAYLSDLGFNMDAAPDTDVLTNPDNQVVKYRSFSSDPQLVTEMAASELKGLNEQGIIGMYKHFPGHGGTTDDSHEGYAYVDDTLEELKSGAFVPFQDGIDNGIQVIMVSHISCPNVTGDNTPATLSKMMITDILRNDMGFDGMVITDAMNMGAITAQYSSSQAAVAALNAGVDMLLMPEDFQSAYQGVLGAVKDGTVSEERIDESVRRILELKLEMEK